MKLDSQLNFSDDQTPLNDGNPNTLPENTTPEPDMFDAARAEIQATHDEGQIALYQEAESRALAPTSAPMEPEAAPVTASPWTQLPAQPIDSKGPPIQGNPHPMTQLPSEQDLYNHAYGFDLPSVGGVLVQAGRIITGSEDATASTGEGLLDLPPTQALAAGMSRDTPGAPAPTDKEFHPTQTDEILSSGNVMAQKKLGEQTRLAPSPQLTAVQQGQVTQQALMNEGDKLTTQAVEASNTLDILAADLDQAKMDVSKTYADEIKHQQIRAQTDYDQARAEVATARAEMAKQDWSTFWGSKDTGDRLLLGLALGLGAYSQTKIGGQNVASEVINGMMKDYNANQQNKFQALKGRLEASSTDSLHILEGAKQLDNLAKANELAQFDQISKQYDAMANRTKSAMTAIDLQKANIAVKQKTIEAEQKINQELAVKNTNVTDILSTPTNVAISPTSGMTLDGTGKVVPMTDKQKDANAVAILSARAYGDMRQLENTGVLNRPAYSAVYNVLTNPTTGAIASTIKGTEAMTRLGSELDAACKNDPGLRLYAQQLQDMATRMTRDLTGASMPLSEVSTEVQGMIATPLGGNTPQDKMNMDFSIRSTIVKQQERIDEFLMKAGNPALTPWAKARAARAPK